MTELAFHNSATRQRESFVPLDPQHVRLYVCGPTVYDLAHLGNARPVVVFDVLARLLRRRFDRVTYVRNITDVDDKINARSQESGEQPAPAGSGHRPAIRATRPARPGIRGNGGRVDHWQNRHCRIRQPLG